MRDERYYNEEFDFEQLIKENADQFKMYPSSNVWKGIHSSLHTPKPWIVSSVLLLAATITLYLVAPFTSSKNSVLPLSKNSGAHRDGVQEAAVISLHNGSKLDQRPEASAEERLYTRMHVAEAPVVPMYTATSMDHDASLTLDPSLQSSTGSIAENVVEESHQLPDETQHAAEVTSLPLSQETEVAPVVSMIHPTLVDEAEEMHEISTAVPTDEYAVFEITKPSVKRWGLQISVSPTMNYRKLVSNKHVALESTVQNIPVAFNLQGSINQLVNHTPAVGFEAAAMFLYAINPRVNFKIGGLFNYSRYYIQAYNSGAMDVARISLGGLNASGNSMTSYSTIRNLGGNSYRGIQNQYFQIAMPIGLEYVLLGQGKFQMGIAGTLQPSFLLNRNSYLITTDYKNYTREPSLVRQLNLNTAAEAFISYKAAHYKFQLGPQFRYQLYSTYDTKYPIKEYLMEYGIKLAVSR